MSKLATVLSFVAGAAIGSVATWYVVKTKYEQIAEEEIAAVKERFTIPKDLPAEDKTEDEKEEPVLNRVQAKPSLMDYANAIRDQRYAEDPKTEVEEESPLDRNPVPYVVSPEEFGEIDDYETISLTYYADQVLTDDDDNVIHDVEDCVGFDSLSHFGEYEDDAVYVRNERLKTDFEILLDQRTYAEVLEKKPYKAEV